MAAFLVRQLAIARHGDSIPFSTAFNTYGFRKLRFHWISRFLVRVLDDFAGKSEDGRNDSMVSPKNRR